MRYFLQLSYLGTNYHGWQRQPNQMSVQEKLEEAFSLILRTPIEITGCGRTDTGVHASQYFAHFDFNGDFPKGFLSRINGFLPKDIAIQRIIEVESDQHARFDATQRSYTYHISFKKDPFQIDTASFISFASKLDIERMQLAAAILLEFKEFQPFCKSNHDAKTLFCDLYESKWVEKKDGSGLIYHISANRFLRGMVRLIVGMSINVGLGRLKIETVRNALEQQILLQRAESAPPEGLFLSEVKYPFIA